MSERQPERAGYPRLAYALVVLVVAVATVGLLMLLDSIASRKQEAQQVALRLVSLDETTVDPAVWGQDFPLEYDSYLRTVDIEKTRHGGSEAFQKLDRDPVWREIFAGYAFGIDYREERGHAWMLQDQRETERVTRVKQPGACLHCHASVTTAYRKKGLEAGAPGTLDLPFDEPDARAQLFAGFEVVCAMPYDEATKLVDHPVACVDCHDPASLRLRVTRPAFLEGVAALARSGDPLPHLPSIGRWREGERDEPYDPNALASRQEMRTLVCAQCHVEYYFRGEEKRLVYPWQNGLRMEAIEALYDAADFADWTHLRTRAPVLKAQHPEFELWSQGTHARAGVACADCHMPYRRVGAVKVSDHHVRSPLLGVHRACQACHSAAEGELLDRVTSIQDRTQEAMMHAEQAVLALIEAIETGQAAKLSDEALAPARKLHRASQWRLDFVAAENSMGFHASQEAVRILGEACDLARRGEAAVLRARLDADAR